MPVEITHPPDPVIIIYLSVVPDEELEHQLHIMTIFMVIVIIIIIIVVVVLVLVVMSFIVRCRSYRIIVWTSILEKGLEKKKKKKSYDSNQHKSTNITLTRPVPHPSGHSVSLLAKLRAIQTTDTN